MKTLFWKIFLGLFLIFVGGCNSLKYSKALYLPQFLEEVNQFDTGNAVANLKTLQDTLNILNKQTGIKVELESSQLEIPIDNFESLNKPFNELMSEHNQLFIKNTGIVGVVLGLFYILSGALLIRRSRQSIKTAYFAISISILFGGVMIFLVNSKFEPMLGEKIGGILFGSGILIDFILLFWLFIIDRWSRTNTREFS